MTKAYEAFILLLLLTLSAGALTIDPDHSWLNACLFTGVFGAGFALQFKLTGRRFLLARQRATVASPEADKAKEDALFYFCGNRLDSHCDPNTPDVLKEMSSLSRVRLMRVATFGILLAYGYGAYQLRVHGRIHTEDLSLIAAALCLLFASSLGHFLVALAIVSGGVLIANLNSHPGQLAWTLAFTFLAILTLTQYPRADEEVAREMTAAVKSKLGHDKADFDPVPAIGIFVLAVAAAFVLNFVIPATKPASRSLSRGTPRSVSQPALKAMPELAPKQEPVPSRQALPVDQKLEISQEQLHELMAALNALSEKPTSGQAETKEPADLYAHLSARMTAQPGSQDGKETTLGAGASGAAAQNVKLDLTPQDLQLLQNALSQYGGKQLGTNGSRDALKTGGSISNSAAAKEETPQNLQKLQDILRQAADRQPKPTVPHETSMPSNPPPPPSASESAPLTQNPSRSIPNAPPQWHLPQLPDLNLKWLAKALKPLLALCIMIAGAVFLSRAFQRSTPDQLEHRPKLSRKKRQELKSRLVALKLKSLSPREEVIRSYHLFLDLMLELGHPRADSVPPTEYQHELTKCFPWLNGATAEISEGFCDSFYGHADLGDVRIGAFRRSFGSITDCFI